jgi:hypothetical protein
MFVGFFRSRTEVQGLNGPCREKEKERPFNRALGDESNGWVEWGRVGVEGKEGREEGEQVAVTANSNSNRNSNGG